jgi:hypothetical protein
VTFRAPAWLAGLLLTALLLSGCNLLSKEPPTLASATVTDQVDAKTRAPAREVTTFPKDSKQLYVSALIKNPRQGTKVQAIWQYDRENRGAFAPVDEKEVSFDKESRERYVAFGLTATTTFPAGTYRVQLLLDGTLAKEITFHVA